MIPVVNSFVTPEYYKLLPGANPPVKALFIASDLQYEPQIIVEQPNKIISTVFKEEKPQALFCRSGIHLYVSPFEQYIGRYANQVATGLIRHEYSTKFGYTNPDVVCGNVVIFGTMNLHTQHMDNIDHSVPYHIVEEAIRLHDIKKSN